MPPPSCWWCRLAVADQDPSCNALYRSDGTYDLLGEDSLLLAQLVTTLAVLIHGSVAGSVESTRMSTAMMELVLTLRYHNQAFVRQSLLYSTTIVFSRISKAFINTEMERETHEIIQWLDSM
jgi:hypothetical protein